MIFDPFTEVISSLGLNSIMLGVFWVIWSDALDILLIKLTSKHIKSKRIRLLTRYFEDHVIETIVYPILVLGSTMFFYVWLLDMGTRLSSGLTRLGLNYSDYGWSLLREPGFFLFLLVIAIGIESSSLKRGMKIHRDIWAGEPEEIRFLWVRIPRPRMVFRSILVTFPANLVLLLSLTRLVDQSIVIAGFTTSGWLPETFLHADGFFGLAWLNDIFVAHSFVMLLATFVPLGMLLWKKMSLSRMWYLIALGAAAVTLVFYYFTVAVNFDVLVRNIQTHFRTEIIEDIGLTQDQALPLLEQEILRTNQLMYIEDISSGFVLPDFVTLLTGLSLVYQMYSARKELPQFG